MNKELTTDTLHITGTDAAPAEPHPTAPYRPSPRARTDGAHPMAVARSSIDAEQATADAVNELNLDGFQELDVQPLELETPDRRRELADAVLRLITENLERMAPFQVRIVLGLLRKFNIDVQDYLTIEFWQGVGTILQYQIQEQTAFVQRRLRGDYQTDPYGMDREIIEVVRPFLVFMYRTWWRVQTEGLEHIPATGRALLVANHSGVLPWDGAMIGTAVYEEHPSARIVRNLFLHWFSTVPFLAPTLTGMGQVPALPENAIRLLEDDELICVFPEGVKGVSKLFQDRYRLARFGRGGFVQAAIRTGAPLLPVAVVGAEETYPMIANAEPIAKLFGFPFFPITPFFPWLGLLGAIPLPTRWSITFCPPITTAEYGPAAADDPLTVFMLTEQIRTTIQDTVDKKLKERSSIF